MSQLLIQKYLNELDRYKKISGSHTEGVTSEAFKDLLKALARQNNLIFINQYEFLSPQKNRIRPDGTILHDLRVPLGYWEAKDTGDKLDDEIRKKLARAIRRTISFSRTRRPPFSSRTGAKSCAANCSTPKNCRGCLPCSSVTLRHALHHRAQRARLPSARRVGGGRLLGWLSGICECAAKPLGRQRP